MREREAPSEYGCPSTPSPCTEGSALIMLPDKNENVERSARNLVDVKTLRASYLNVRDLLGHDYLLIPQESLGVIEGILG